MVCRVWGHLVECFVLGYFMEVAFRSKLKRLALANSETRLGDQYSRTTECAEIGSSRDGLTKKNYS